MLATGLAYAALLAVQGDVDERSRQVLAANRTASAPSPRRDPALRLHYRYVGNGLTGVIDEVYDLRRPAFVVSRQIGGFTEQEGFDGAAAWARERSGSVNMQSGGDMRELAMSQAYRTANRWWEPDHGGATIAYVDRKSVGGSTADILRVSPRGGTSFDAWFDSRTHLLMRVEERRHGQAVVIRFLDYRNITGSMLAGRVESGTEDPTDKEVQTLDGAEFLSAVPASCCSAPGWTATDAAIVGGAHRTVIPFRIVNSHIYADVSINGKGTFPFLFDTGGVNILTPETARSAQVDAAGSLSMRGGGAGSISGGIASVSLMTIGGAAFSNQPMRVLPLSDSEIKPAGMIGFETFRRLVTRIDYGRHTIEFIEPRSFDPRDAGIPVPIDFYGNLPTVEGSFDGRPGHFTIDTGNPGSLFLSSPFDKRHGLSAKVRGGIRTIAGVGIGGPSYGLAFRGAALKLGEVTVPRPVTLASSDTAGAMADPSLAGNVGADILRRFVVTLDYAKSLMYLKPLSHPPSNLDRYDASGMRVTRTPEGVQVSDVVETGPAAIADVRKGDLITAVNGKSTKALALDDIRALLRDQPPGTAVGLELRRSAKPLSVTLTLRTLL